MPEPKQGFLAKIDSSAWGVRHAELWKFLKSCIAGGMGAIPEMILYMALPSLFTARGVTWLPEFFFFDLILKTRGEETANYTLAAVVWAFVISTAVGQAIGFVLNRKVAFHADSNVALSTFLTFLLVVFTIAANAFVGPAIEAFMGRLAFLPQWLIDMATKVLSMCASVAWVYPANRFLIHRRTGEKALRA